MESKINYTVVGIFVIGLGIALVFIFLWLTSTRHDKAYKTYLIYVNENVTGLAVQGPVRYNGVPVGLVKSIVLDPKNPQLVRIVVDIEVGTPITTSTVATIQLQGITGVMYVGLKATATDAPLLQPEPGQKYPVIRSKPSFFVQISEVLPEVTKNVRKIGDSVTKLLSDENQQAIRKSLQHIETFTDTLAKNSDNLNEIMESLKKTMKNTAKASEGFPELAKDLQKAINSVDKTATQLGQAAKSAKQTFNGGKVIVQNFSNQVMPSAQQALQNLSAVAKNLDHLTQELQTNPSMLVRGKAPAAKGPGE